MKLRFDKKEIMVEVGGGKFYGVPLDPSETEELRRKHTRYTRVSGQVIPDTDYTELKIETIQRTIVRIEDVENEDTGEPVTCDANTLRVLFLCNPTVMNEVMDKFTAAGRGPDPVKVDLLGNSQDG